MFHVKHRAGQACGFRDCDSNRASCEPSYSPTLSHRSSFLDGSSTSEEARRLRSEERAPRNLRVRGSGVVACALVVSDGLLGEARVDGTLFEAGGLERLRNE